MLVPWVRRGRRSLTSLQTAPTSSPVRASADALHRPLSAGTSRFQPLKDKPGQAHDLWWTESLQLREMKTRRKLMRAFLPEQTRISQVHLRTGGLERAPAFYTD